MHPDMSLCPMGPLYRPLSHHVLPWTCVWYTTKYSSFPQVSNSCPRQWWRHRLSSSGSWSEKRGVGKPQWHRSPPRTASVFSWNTAAIKTPKTHSCVNDNARMHTSRKLPHPLRAHVHTFFHRHVLDDRADGKCQSDIVRPVKTPLKNGAAVWNTQNKQMSYTNRRGTNSKYSSAMVTEHSFCSLASIHWPHVEGSHWDSLHSAGTLTCQHIGQ